MCEVDPADYMYRRNKYLDKLIDYYEEMGNNIEAINEELDKMDTNDLSNLCFDLGLNVDGE